MSSLPRCFATFLAAWNEQDPAKRRDLIAASVTEDIVFTDPDHQIVGIAAVDRMITEFRAREGLAKLAPTSGIDMHHDRARYGWVVLRPDGTRFEGFDAVALDLGQGKISRIDGFFGAMPAVGTARVA